MKKKNYDDFFYLSNKDIQDWEKAISNVEPLKYNKPFDIQKQISYLANEVNIKKQNKDFLNTDFYKNNNNLDNFDRKIIKNIKNNTLKIDKYIDLHGYNSEIAEHKIKDFVIDAYNNKLKLILVITGKGKNSKYDTCILKDVLKNTIENSYISNYIISYSDSLIKHGGSGASYILLKKNKRF